MAPPSLMAPSLATRPQAPPHRGPPVGASPRQPLASTPEAPRLESSEKVHTPSMSEAEPERPQSRQRPRQVAPSLSSLHSNLGINSLLPERHDPSPAAQPKPEPSASNSVSNSASSAPVPPEVPKSPSRVAPPSSAAPAGPRRPVFPKVQTCF
eukprot:gnl/MRDRNA2_/MRDRNA2_17619_c0_seq1.p1 gnl/MRDRNA2_/MRDRNA2_17619_c0~~gnl/MRDRNA2_/MRDRNA2_17619_c0_seq1.p1  ORF type:complete len:178 (-),score=23.00 gnl/MRDRNA2_/MRDRNA2_17619_c0_seq1:13-471(-)